MNPEVSYLIGIFGLILLSWRMRIFRRQLATPASNIDVETESRSVSIIVPARNEERVIGRLLQSLSNIEHPNFEVVVVDDCSSDQTAQIASSFNVRVISGQPRPEAWNGKQWACHQGAIASNGDYLIFTDADTWHQPDSLQSILGFMQRGQLGMASSLPFHHCESIWEYLTGPFHILLCFATSPFSTPKFRRVFAVGQYLAFKRSAYFELGGHEAVRQSWVEDVPMANLALKRGIRYGLYTDRPLHQVRMYETLSQFLAGWRRNFRAGLTETHWLAPFEIAAVFYAMTGAWQFGMNPISLVIMILTALAILLIQRRYGNFSILGPTLFPFSIALFCFVSISSLTDMLFKREAIWKGRNFSKISSPV